MEKVLQREFPQERKNVLLLKTVSRYGSIDRYIEAWADAMRKFGCNTCVLDGWSLAQPGLYNHVISNYKFDAVLDLNGALCSWGITKKLPLETIYGIYLCDPPIGLKEKLEQADDRTIVFCCDKRFCDYTERYFPMVKHTAFIPLSGSAYPTCKSYGERNIDIIFTGTYQDPQKIKEEILANFEKGGVLELFVNDMLEDIVTNFWHTLSECLSAILKKYGQEVSDAEFHELMGEFWQVDFYARFYYRDKVICALLNAGLKLHVFGNGWENFHSGQKDNLVIHKGGTYAAEKALANAKIALNIMPWFKDAFQERIASAMLSKTVAVTDESKYITDHFENDKELLVYSLKDIDELPGRIQYLLDHPMRASEIAENGYQKVQSHTWTARVHDMLRKMEKDFGVSFIREGEGRELEFEIDYPDEQTVVLDAVYELQKMAALAECNVGEMESVSDTDTEYMIRKYKDFTRQFSKRLNGMEMNDYIRNCLLRPQGEHAKHAAELFSLQCKALIGKMLLEEKGYQL